MGVVGDALAWVSALAIDVLSTTGYAGLFLLMVAESLVLPVPSEAVMPFAGYLIAQGEMGWFGAIAASTLGSAVGSWLGYLMGRHGLLPLVERYGKYVFVKPHHVHHAQAYFAKRGTWAVFLCRFIPGVRHVSSIPAGATRMPLVPFLVASTLGAAIWNVILLVVGYKVGNDEKALHAIKSNMDLVGIGLLLLVVAYVVYEVRQARKEKAASTATPDEAHP